MTKWMHSLLIVCLLFVFVPPPKAEAVIGEEVVLPAAAYGAVAVYVATALGVAAIGGYVGYEYSDEIRNHAKATWNGANEVVKTGIQTAVNAANNIGDVAINLSQEVKDWINLNWNEYKNLAYPKVQANFIQRDVDYSQSIQGNFIAISALSGTTFMINGKRAGVIFYSGGTAQQGSNIDIAYAGGIDYPTNPTQRVKISEFICNCTNMSGDARVSYVLSVAGVYVTKTSLPTNTPTLDSVLPSTPVQVPPLTSFDIKASDGTPLTYDYQNGTYKVTSTNLPYEGNPDTVVWTAPAPQYKDVDGVKKVGVTIPVAGQDVFYGLDGVHADPVPLQDYTVSLPQNGAIDLFYPATTPFQIGVVYYPQNVTLPALDMTINPPDIAVVDPATGIITPTKTGIGTLTISDPAGVVPRIYEIPIVIAHNTNLPPPSGGSNPPPPPGGWNIFDWLKYLLELIVWIILAVVYFVTLASNQLTQLNSAVGGLKSILVTVFSTTPPLVLTLIGFAVVMSIISGLMRRK